MYTQILSCRNLSKVFTQNHHKIQIFNNINYQFFSDKSYALMGPSGVGKSTLIAMMVGIDHPTSGSVFFNDFMISDQLFEQRMQLLEKKISIIFQQPCLIAELTVLENVMLKSIIRETVSEKTKKHALTLLAEVGLESKSLEFAHNLSGGQQQRLCIARALAVSPTVLLMDEPTSALDPISTAKIEELLGELKKSVTIVIVTHNMQQAARVSDQTAFFLFGELVELGPTSQIFTAPRESRTERYITGRFG